MKDRQHYYFYGYNSEMIPIYMPKKGYENEVDAIMVCFKLNLAPHSIHKAVSYKCGKCGKWHIGHNKTTLTDRKRDEIRKQFEHFKKVHNIKC